MSLSLPRSALLLAALTLAVACGEGSGPGGTTSDTLLSMTALNGIVQNDGTVSTTATIAAGDVDAAIPGRTTRGFYSFDLSGIPAANVIRTANLRLVQFAVSGSPYATLGNVVVDHVTYGARLDAGDYGGGTVVSGFGVLSSDATTGVRLLNVFTRVNADREAGRSVSQFRLRFSLVDGNNDGVTDLAGFNDEDDVPPAMLILTYE